MLRLKAEKKSGNLATPTAGTTTTGEVPLSIEEKRAKENRELRSLNSDKTGDAIPDLLADVRKALACAQLSPLGTDSAFRR